MAARSRFARSPKSRQEQPRRHGQIQSSMDAATPQLMFIHM